MPSLGLTRRKVLTGSALFAPALVAGYPSWGSVSEVGDSDSLIAALRNARGGETILLAPGNYGTLKLRNGEDGDFSFALPVTMRSSNLDQPVVMQGMELAGFENLTLDSLFLAHKAEPGENIDKRCFRISGGRGITVRKSVFKGDLIREGAATSIGLPTGIGLNISRSTDVLVEDNLVFDFYRGIAMGEGTNVVLRRNELRGIRMDGMVFTKSRGLLIEANFLHSFQRSKAKSDHADMIQFWTNGAEFATTDVTIRGNLLMAGPGGASQSIFMRNDMVDRKLAGRELFYRNILIEENVIINGHAHGITLGATEGVVIRNNTLLRNHLFAKGADLKRAVKVPRIKLSALSLDATITGNIVAAVSQPQPGWTVANNLIVQDISPSEPGFYGDIFRDPFGEDTEVIENYLYLGDPGAGAALLRPSANRSAFRPA